MVAEDPTQVHRSGGPRSYGGPMHFTATVHREGRWFVSQAVEIDVASQGKSEAEALSNLREALELYFMPDGRSILRQAALTPEEFERL